MSHNVKKKSKKNPLNKTLARPGDPLVTERGLLISPDRDDVDLTEKDDEINAKAFRPKKQISAKDLPAPPQMMKAVSCVFLFSVLGLTERETATVLGISAGDVKSVKASPVYTECFNTVLRELISANSELLQARVASYAGDALTNVAHIASSATKDETKLMANRDLLDRAGVGVQKGGISIGIAGNELRIQYVDSDKTADIDVRQ